MFLQFFRSLLQWISGINLEKIFWLTVIVSVTTVSWVLVKDLIQADGRINYCYTEQTTRNSGLAVIPTTVIKGHKDWKPDVVLGEFLFHEQAVEVMTSMPTCR